MSIRKRTTGSFTRPFTGQVDRTLCDGTQFVAGTTTSLIETGVQVVTYDVVTPNFASLRKRGFIINNPFYTQKIEKTGSCSGSRSVTWVPPCTGSGTKTDTLSSAYVGQGAPIWPQWDDASLRDACIAEVGTKALANVAAPDVMGMVELAEIKKTVAMIRNPLVHIKDFLNEVRGSKRFKRSGITSFGDFMTSEWLRYRYGIMPALGTLEGIRKIMTAVKRSPRYTARGFSTRTYSKLTGTPVINNGDPFSTQTMTGVKTGGITASSGVLYEYNFELVDRSGFRIQDIPPTLYELVPYSFVVDWFVNLGDYIQAITPKAGVTVLAAWTGYREETVVHTHDSYVGKAVANFSISDTRHGEQKVVTTTKSRWPGAVARLAQSEILFDRPRDWNHLADGLSLIVKRLV